MRMVRFRYKTLNGFVLFSLIFLLIGSRNFCSEVACAEERIGDGNTVVLSQQDSGKQIDVKVGEVVQVELEAMGTAGYRWFVDPLNQSILRLVSEETKVLHPGRIGAPALTVWRFEVIREGVTDIRMDHYRSWEGKAHSTDHFEVKIKVDR